MAAGADVLWGQPRAGERASVELWVSARPLPFTGRATLGKSLSCPAVSSSLVMNERVPCGVQGSGGLAPPQR